MGGTGRGRVPLTWITGKLYNKIKVIYPNKKMCEECQ